MDIDEFVHLLSDSIDQSLCESVEHDPLIPSLTVIHLRRMLIQRAHDTRDAGAARLAIQLLRLSGFESSALPEGLVAIAFPDAPHRKGASA